jgi:hypothetical protein
LLNTQATDVIDVLKEGAQRFKEFGKEMITAGTDHDSDVTKKTAADVDIADVDADVDSNSSNDSESDEDKALDSDMFSM